MLFGHGKGLSPIRDLLSSCSHFRKRVRANRLRQEVLRYVFIVDEANLDFHISSWTSPVETFAKCSIDPSTTISSIHVACRTSNISCAQARTDSGGRANFAIRSTSALPHCTHREQNHEEPSKPSNRGIESGNTFQSSFLVDFLTQCPRCRTAVWLRRSRYFNSSKLSQLYPSLILGVMPASR